MPRRIQLRREKGWRLPKGAVSVARPGKWGNPFRIGSHDKVGAASTMIRDARTAALFYRIGIRHGHAQLDWHDKDIRVVMPSMDEIKQLAGKDLACWCPLDQPCHADVLLELANEVAP